MRTGRIRGAWLRVAYRRPLAFGLGLLLAGVSAALALGDYSWESAFSDGVGMIVGATGVALVLMALGGRQPDWEE